MSYPDQEEGLPGGATRQPPLPPPKLHSSETVSLRRSLLERIPDSVLRNSSLTYLCLEGNHISGIPPSLFSSLPNLLWFDLRLNQITSLPAEIGSHRCLKTLLLEGNPISELPLELGNVISLSGLNLRDCPIRFPPHHILQQGLQVILQYLRTALAQRPVVTGKTSPEFPTLEKLQLSELTGSVGDEKDDEDNEDDLRKFRELKEKLILLDGTELGSAILGSGKSQVVSACISSSGSREMSGLSSQQQKASPQQSTSRSPRSSVSSAVKRKKTTAEMGVIPRLPLFDAQHRKRPQERRQAAVKAEKEKQAILEQRRKSREALQQWRTKAKLAQEEKMSELRRKKLERQRKQEEEALITGLEDGDGSPSVAEDRSVSELQQQIRAHVEKMQENRRNPKGSRTEQVAAAEDDVKQMTRLQALVEKKRRNQGKELEKTFSIFSADVCPDITDKVTGSSTHAV